VITQAKFLLTQQLPKTSANIIANEGQGLRTQNPALTIDDATQAFSNTTRNPNQHIIFKSAELRLPMIELSKFSNGDISNWFSFRDTFESLIYKKETIDSIQRFHYLKASLEGSAAQIIKSLEFSVANYAMVYNMRSF